MDEQAAERVMEVETRPAESSVQSEREVVYRQHETWITAEDN